MTRYFGKFLTAAVFVTGLFFAPNAFAASTNIAVPFDWQAAWGRLPDEKIPAEMHTIKEGANNSVTCTGNLNHNDILMYAVDYKGEGRSAYVGDISRYYLPYRNSAVCPEKLCITENDKDFCGLGCLVRLLHCIIQATRSITVMIMLLLKEAVIYTLWKKR